MMHLYALKRIEDVVGVIEPGREFLIAPAEGERLIAAGRALRADSDMRAPWAALPWTGASVVCIASGPSLTWVDCESVRAWREQENGTPRRVIVVNNTWQLAPWADVLYACDDRWWNLYADRTAAAFRGERWTQDDHAARKFGLRRVASVDKHGLSRLPGVIHQGSNSGFQAVNLAYIAGAARIVLLGFDMQMNGGRGHWHDDHPPELRTFPIFERWITSFRVMAEDFERSGVPVLNASRATALDCFPRVELAEALA